MRYVAAGLVPMVSRVGRTIVAVSPPSARRRNASQAEYAGSIPVIGSTNPRFGGIFRDCQTRIRNGLLTVARDTTLRSRFAGRCAG